MGVADWRDAAGSPGPLRLAEMGGRYQVIFCFQHNCPGCHQRGFPTLQRLVDAFRGSRFVRFAAVQTVFEEYERNTAELGFADQQRYALTIPFGHDAGPDGRFSTLMQRYRSGGTPWFIVIDPQGVVIFNHFHIDADRLIEFCARPKLAIPAMPRPVLTWLACCARPATAIRRRRARRAQRGRVATPAVGGAVLRHPPEGHRTRPQFIDVRSSNPAATPAPAAAPNSSTPAPNSTAAPAGRALPRPWRRMWSPTTPTTATA